MWPLPIVYGIGQDHRKAKSNGYINYPKDALTAVDGEADSSGIGSPQDVMDW